MIGSSPGNSPANRRTIMLRSASIIAIVSAAIFSIAPPDRLVAATAPPKPVSGCVNQLLTDGSWNLKVTGAKLGVLPDSTTPAWSVTFQFGNVRTAAANPGAHRRGQPRPLPWG